MKSTVFRYGIYSMLAIVALSAIHFFILMPVISMESGEVFGYLTMILSMVFVFAGIRHYRDRVNGGVLTFGQGMKIGVLIVLIPSVAFGLFDILYTEVIEPGWMDRYYLQEAEKIRTNYSAVEAAKKLKDLEASREMFSNPVFQFLLMSVTVFIIGLIVTIISSLTLRRAKNANALKQTV